MKERFMKIANIQSIKFDKHFKLQTTPMMIIIYIFFFFIIDKDDSNN